MPPELTVLLSRKQEQALNHVTRRRILRAIHTSGRPLSPKQLSSEEGALSDVFLGTVSYHMNMLRKYGMVAEDHTKSRRGATEHFFVSEVVDNGAIRSVLDGAEELDAPHRDSGGE
ncbi:MAG TPA: helix-turn-helix domain-containing protein [Solirubrobacterales bacterium]